jgi:alginate O-acetyltransferase complex protein AlgI
MILMWTIAFLVYTICKILSFIYVESGSLTRNLLYLFAWPGMDAQTFLHSTKPEKVHRHEIIISGVNAGIGLSLIVNFNIPILNMIGVVLILHFGLFHILSVIYRLQGIDAKHIMNWPVAATSVSDFWSNRWNLAFRDLSHNFILKPLKKPCGIALATFIVFLVSGIVHDVVNSNKSRL